jgi:hypothetical protein
VTGEDDIARIDSRRYSKPFAYSGVLAMVTVTRFSLATVCFFNFGPYSEQSSSLFYCSAIIIIIIFFFFGAPKSIFFIFFVQYLGVTAGIEPET